MHRVRRSVAISAKGAGRAPDGHTEEQHQEGEKLVCGQVSPQSGACLGNAAHHRSPPDRRRPPSAGPRRRRDRSEAFGGSGRRKLGVWKVGQRPCPTKPEGVSRRWAPPHLPAQWARPLAPPTAHRLARKWGAGPLTHRRLESGRGLWKHLTGPHARKHTASCLSRADAGGSDGPAQPQRTAAIAARPRSPSGHAPNGRQTTGVFTHATARKRKIREQSRWL